ncbi:MFS transporter [Acrocarpospora macrocephala]|uniref:MFS transporter n=1 Tax=Acrocarpospora macrocephala TaxID=150177 RepID=UPI001478D41F|nr:MFS transporter [Acrocarpospora macrocephala]
MTPVQQTEQENPGLGYFSRLWTASICSGVAFRTLGVVYPLLALHYAQGSSAIAAWVGFVWTIPGVILYLPAGAIIDRVGPRRVMLWTEATRVIVMASVLIPFAFGQFFLIHLFIAAGIEGLMWVFYTLAETAVLPTLLDERDTATSAGPYARIELGTHGAALSGRPLGGFLMSLAHFAPFLLSSVLFISSYVLLRRVKAETVPQPVDRNLLAEAIDGFKVVRRRKFLLAVTSTTAFTNLMIQALIMVFIAGSYDLSPSVVGLVLSASGMGGVLGSLLAMKFTVPAGMWFLQLWIWTPALLIAATWHSPLSFALAMFLSGLSGSLNNVAHKTFEAEHVSDEWRARVASASRLAGRVASSVAAPTGAALVAWFTVTPATWVLAVVTLSATLFVTFTVWGYGKWPALR